MVHEVAILNAVLGNHGARARTLVRHAEDVLRRDVVLGHAPAHVLLHVGCLVTDDFKIARGTIDRNDLEFLAVFIGIRGVVGLLQFNVVADLQTGEILAHNTGLVRVMLHGTDIVADEVGAHVVQLIGREVVVAAEVVVHVNLQAPSHGNVVQIVLPACEGDAGFFNADAPRFEIALAAKLVGVA